MDNLQNVQLMVVGSVNGGVYSYSTFLSLTEIPQLISLKMPQSSGRVNQILYIFLSVICSKNYTEKSIDKILQLDQPEEKQTRHWIDLTWDAL